MSRTCIRLIATGTLILLLTAPALASSHGHGSHGKSPNPAAAENQVVSAKGVITAIDPAGRQITLKHQPIPAINWPAMTMELDLADPALAAGLAPGDQIVFDLKRLSATDYVITGIRKER